VSDVIKSCPSSPVIVALQRPLVANDATSRNVAGSRTSGFNRATPGRLSVGARRLPAGPDDTIPVNQVSGIGSPRIGSDRRQAAVVQTDSQTRFERGTSTRSSLPIVRSTSATSGSLSPATVSQKSTLPQRVASCRQSQRPLPTDFGGESRLGATIAVDDITDREMAAMSTAARSVHPVGVVGSSSPASGRSTPRKILPISAGSGKKQPSKATGKVDMKLKGERLSNYNKVCDVGTSSTTPLSTPPSHRVHPASPQSLLQNGNTSPLVDGRRHVIVEPLPALCPDYVVHTPFVGDPTGNRCASPPMTTSSSSCSTFDYRRDVDDVRGSSSARRQNLELQFSGGHNGTVVISNPAAILSSTSRSSATTETRQSRPLPDVSQGRLIIDSHAAMTSSSLTDIGSCLSSVQLNNRRRPLAAAGQRKIPSGAETDVEEIASGRRESSRTSANRKLGGLDWFNDSRVTAGTLPHKSSASTSADTADSPLASPTSGLHKPPSAVWTAGVVTSSSSLSATHHPLACRTASTPVDNSILTSRLAMVTSPSSKGGTLTRITQQSETSFRSRLNSAVEENGAF